MATLIKDTPILYGKDSDRFLKAIRKNEHKRMSKEEHDKAMKNYHAIMEKATFRES